MPKRVTPLTATQVKNAKPKEIGKESSLPDGKNLFLKITISGTKIWVFKYYRPNIVDGKKPRTNISFGQYPTVSLADARKKREWAMGLLAKGIDPKTQREEDKQFDSLESVANQWMKVKRSSGITQDHGDDIIRSLQLHIFPKLGNLPITAINAPETIETLRPLEAKGSLDQVSRVCQRLNEVMMYALNAGIIPHNSLTGIKSAFKKSVKTHFSTISSEELPQFLKTLSNASIKLVTRNLILFSLHTMVRPNESAGAKWNEIDFDKKLWTIPAERMKKNKIHTIPLTNQVMELLEEMKAISGAFEFIFTGDRNKHQPTNSSTANTAISRMGYKGILVAHGMRSLASTTLNEQGFDADLVEVALSHIDKNEVRAAYNRAEYVERRRKMMQWWSEHIEQAYIGAYTTSKKGLSLV